MESNAKVQPIVSEQGTSITWADLSNDPSFVIGEDVSVLILLYIRVCTHETHVYVHTHTHASSHTLIITFSLHILDFVPSPRISLCYI